MLNPLIYAKATPIEHKYKRYCEVCGKGIRSHTFSTRRNQFKKLDVVLPVLCHGDQQRLLASRERTWL
jgi:hypothetical protein